MKYRLKTLLFGMTLFAATAAQAEFQHTNWLTDNDQLATLDTETGLEWLNLSQTEGLSVNATQTALNDSLLGWRFATHDEVYDLFVRALPSWIDNGTTSQDQADTGPIDVEFDLFAQWFGFTQSDTHSYGYVYDPSQGGSSQLFGLRHGTNRVYVNYGNYTLADSSTYYGNWLVSDGGTTLSSKADPSINTPGSLADVNAPFGLFLAGLILAGIGRRRH